MNFVEKYISLIEDKYIVHREFNDFDYKFGEFDSLSKAIEFRDKIDSDGWPLKKDTPFFTPDNKKSIKYSIKKFVENEIIYLDRNVKENDPNIFMIFKIFNEKNKDKDIKVSIKNFKYHFPRLIDKKLIKRELINNSTRYNISFADSKYTNPSKSEKNSLHENNSLNVNINKPKLKELHGHIEVVPRLEEFFNKEIIILNRKSNENDPILDDICIEFNKYLKKFNEKIKINSLSNYFSSVLQKNKNADKLVIGGKTHYNIKLKSNLEQSNKKNSISKTEPNSSKNTIDFKIEINEINDITLFDIHGSTDFNNFSNILNKIKNFQNEFISVNLEQKNNKLLFHMKLIDKKSNKDTYIVFINSILM